MSTHTFLILHFNHLWLLLRGCQFALFRVQKLMTASRVSFKLTLGDRFIGAAFLFGKRIDLILEGRFSWAFLKCLFISAIPAEWLAYTNSSLILFCLL